MSNQRFLDIKIKMKNGASAPDNLCDLPIRARTIMMYELFGDKAILDHKFEELRSEEDLDKLDQELLKKFLSYQGDPLSILLLTLLCVYDGVGENSRTKGAIDRMLLSFTQKFFETADEINKINKIFVAAGMEDPTVGNGEAGCNCPACQMIDKKIMEVSFTLLQREMLETIALIARQNPLEN